MAAFGLVRVSSPYWTKRASRGQAGPELRTRTNGRLPVNGADRKDVKEEIRQPARRLRGVLDKLSAREHQVLELVAQGLDNATI